MAMSLTEYDEEDCIRTWRNDGIAEGREQKAIEDAQNLLKKNISPEIIAKCIGLSLEEVQKLAEELATTTV